MQGRMQDLLQAIASLSKLSNLVMMSKTHDHPVRHCLRVCRRNRCPPRLLHRDHRRPSFHWVRRSLPKALQSCCKDARPAISAVRGQNIHRNIKDGQCSCLDARAMRGIDFVL